MGRGRGNASPNEWWGPQARAGRSISARHLMYVAASHRLRLPRVRELAERACAGSEIALATSLPRSREERRALQRCVSRRRRAMRRPGASTSAPGESGAPALDSTGERGVEANAPGVGSALANRGAVDRRRSRIEEMDHFESGVVDDFLEGACRHGMVVPRCHGVEGDVLFHLEDLRGT